MKQMMYAGVAVSALQIMESATETQKELVNHRDDFSEIMSKPKQTSAKRTMADLADKFSLYETSVQMPDHEVNFFIQAYRDARQQMPYTLGEDFCGTFAVSCHWVQSDEKRSAIAIDSSRETLKWGRDHNLSRLREEQQKRVTLMQQDVRNRNSKKVDVIAAQNFSFWSLKTRREVLDYFRSALAGLADDGIMVLDMMGGAECRIEGLTHKQTIREGRDGFSYIWKQVSYNPINSDTCCSISFKFADGSRLQDAFVYHWRLWTIVEVREMLSEAGFSKTHVYWAIDEDLDAEPDLAWQRREKAPSDASWTCYLVAIK